MEQQEAEALTAAHQRLQAETHAEKIIEELRALGHWPSAGRQKKLLEQICEAMVAGNFSTADEATNRLEKDLLMATSGMRTKEVMRHIRCYKMFWMSNISTRWIEHQQLARTYHQAAKDGKISSLDQEEAKKLTPAQYGR